MLLRFLVLMSLFKQLRSGRLRNYWTINRLVSEKKVLSIIKSGGVIVTIDGKEVDLLIELDLPLNGINEIVISRNNDEKNMRNQDAAMSVTQEATDIGGIDLNPANTNLQIQRDPGQMGVPLRFEGIENMNIQGLTPVIINITPALIPNLFSGLEKAEESELSLVK